MLIFIAMKNDSNLFVCPFPPFLLAEKPCHPSASGAAEAGGTASQSAASSVASYNHHSTFSSSSTSEEDEQNTQLSSEQLDSLGASPLIDASSQSHRESPLTVSLPRSK